jgi:hypothetical protein
MEFVFYPAKDYFLIVVKNRQLISAGFRPIAPSAGSGLPALFSAAPSRFTVT